MLFEDEFSLSNTATLSATWSQKGKQPVVISKQKERERLTGFGSVNPISGQIIVDFKARGNAVTFKQHLDKILYIYKDYQKITIFLDNVRFHHAKILRPFLQAHSKLDLQFLPAYSPDMNPVERVWWYMRKSITHNRYLVSMKERKAKFWKLFSKFIVPNDTLKRLCVLNF